MGPEWGVAWAWGVGLSTVNPEGRLGGVMDAVAVLRQCHRSLLALLFPRAWRGQRAHDHGKANVQAQRQTLSGVQKPGVSVTPGPAMVLGGCGLCVFKAWSCRVTIVHRKE